MDGLFMKYFVLKPQCGDPYGEASCVAIQAYAERIRELNPDLAEDLDNWINDLIHNFVRDSM